MIHLGFILKRILLDLAKRATYPYLPFPMKTRDDRAHLEATMRWLVRAAQHGEGGVSSHYSLLSGKWLPPFPETTGYIIPTLFDYARFSSDKSSFDLAVQLTDWLIDVQLDSGACMGGNYSRRKRKGGAPIIFNTGQNIFGFLRSFQETGNEKYLEAAIRAGDFLVAQTGTEGCWNQALHHNLPHTYNTRTSWALLQLHEVSGVEKYCDVALINLEWAVEQQHDNGWFDNASFKPGELPNTHGLAYTTRGLLECYFLVHKGWLLVAAQRTADTFLRLFEIRKQLYIFWDERLQNHGKYFHRQKGRHICLTGNIQFSLIWMRLFELIADPTYLNAAFKMLDHVKLYQDLMSRNDGIRGGVPGSFPIYGSYSSLKYPNWAAKFFADALIKKVTIMSNPCLFETDKPQPDSV